MPGTVIVTGATRGIGLAISTALASLKYDLHLLARSSETLAELAAMLSARSRRQVGYTPIDLTNADAIEAFVHSWESPLYGLVNNAGAWAEAPLGAGDLELYQRLNSLNLEAPLRLTSAMSQHFRERGRIVNITSQLAHRGRSGFSAYAATKHGLLGLTRCWALELAPRQITVNAVSPGWVRTDSNMTDIERFAESRGDSTAAILLHFEKTLPSRRLIEPTEVARVVAFLLSAAASGITGQEIVLT